MSQLTFDGSMDKPKIESTPRKESWYKGRVLSYSSVNLYQTCPQKWKFRYIDKVPEKPKSFFSFGKSVHNALEFLFSKIPLSVPTLEEVLANYKEGWIQEGYESPSRERWFYQEGERILKGFYAKHNQEFKNVYHVEYKFNFDIEGVPLTGFIDRIDETPSGKINIVDYKTGRAFDKSRVRQDAQLTLYQLAAKKLLNKDIDKVGLYHLNSLTPLMVPAHSAELEDQIKSTVVESAKGINENQFEAKPDAAGHCRWCDYVQICPAFIGKKLPLSIKSLSESAVKDDIDRLGEINQNIEELKAEKKHIEKSIHTQLDAKKISEAQGRQYKVSLENKELKTEPFKGD